MDVSLGLNVGHMEELVADVVSASLSSLDLFPCAPTDF